MKRRKRRRKLHTRKVVLLNMVLVVFVFLGIGYSFLNTELTIDGDMSVKKYVDTSLYNVLKKEVEANGLAKEYTGDHQDSIDASLSTEKIYHWYGNNATEGASILNKNNVIFANQCWQMIRTTDTGGVKMMYNGEAENNQCLTTRGNHIGYNGAFSKDMTIDYWYGTDYTYDSTNNVFSVSGTTEFSSWNATTGPNLVGKYTCGHSLLDSPCSTIYYVESYVSPTTATFVSIDSDINYTKIGNLPFNLDFNSPAYLGYMYGDIYEFQDLTLTEEDMTEVSRLLIDDSMDANYYYSKTINKNGSSYTLINPILGSNIPNGDYSGYYTFASSSVTSGTEIKYLFGKDDENGYYYKNLNYPLEVNDYVIAIANNMIDNGNDTYTLDDISYVTITDWYNNYANYEKKYTCGDYYTTTCSHPSYIISTKPDIYEYVDSGIKFMIGKNKSGTTLTDTLLVRRDEWYDDYSSANNVGNFGEYKYTCNTTSANCTDQNLRMIYYKTEKGYYYLYNHYWGSSATWDGTKYTLVNPIGIENYDNFTELNTHHYTCVEWGATSCTRVAYVYNYNLEFNLSVYGEKYVYLENGVTDPSQLLSDMFEKNTTNSVMKNGLESWYKRNLLSYDDYIEDTIYCNNREISNLYGWNPNGGALATRLTYEDNEVNTDLYCTKVTDRFSVNNPQAQLTYKIGLPTFSEVNLLNTDSARTSTDWYWLFSPNYMHWYTPFILVVDTNGSVSYVPSFEPGAVRPVISLKAGTKYLSGDGSMATPYIITTD